MDPISAFALAGTVVTFVDFGGKLIIGAKQLYKTTSGALPVNDELELATADLRSVIQKIHTFNVTSRNSVKDAHQSAADAEFEDGFVKMCDSALEIAEELLARLESLKVDPKTKGALRVWKSLSQAMSSAWSSKELAVLSSKLLELKKMLEFRILIQLSTKLDTLCHTVSKGFESLDQHSKYIISALAQSGADAASNETKLLTATLVTILGRIETANTQEHRRTRALINAPRPYEDQVTSTSEVLEVPYHEENKLRLSVTNEILNDLNFDTRTHRLEQITDAHRATFNWVFDPVTANQKPWYNLSKWLRRDNGVYWIQGKAGAGKSTLMSYIYQDPRTRHMLNNWGSKDVPLYVGSFFFWLSGTREQKSLQGLLRSILFEVLNEDPDLVAVVLPHIWAQAYGLAVSHNPGLSTKSWSLKELKDAFRLLVQQNIIPMKLCLFIDGLDEFDGDHCDHEEISELLKDITSDNVKVCLSSRPWVVFTECFRGLPSLRLQDLTEPDIQAYVYHTLSGNSFFRSLARGHEAETNIFKSDIVEMAEGVFLWVTLAVRSLLNGIRNRDSIPDLHLRLLYLPKELEPLYTHLLNLVEPGYFLWAAKAFQIVRTAQEHISKAGPLDSSIDNHMSSLTVLDLHMSIEQSFDLASIDSWTNEEINRQCDDANIHITARCAGLLETLQVRTSRTHSSFARIQFLHRTAQDYIYTPSVWLRITSATASTTFDPVDSLLRAYALQSTFGEDITEQDAESCIRKALSYGCAADAASRKPIAVPDILFSAVNIRIKRGDPWLRDLTAEFPPFDSTLPIAAMFGFTNFLHSQSVEARSKLTSGGASLLHYAIPRQKHDAMGALQLIPCASTVKFLLQTCDVNLSYNGFTPWGRALTNTQELVNYSFPYGLREQVIQQVKVLKHMLQAGASPRDGPRAQPDPQENPRTLTTDLLLCNVVGIVSNLKAQIESSRTDLTNGAREQILELHEEVQQALALIPPKSKSFKTWLKRKSVSISGRIR